MIAGSSFADSSFEEFIVEENIEIGVPNKHPLRLVNFFSTYEDST